MPLSPRSVPLAVQRRLSTSGCFIGIDVETNALAQSVKHWIQGQYGFECKIEANGLEMLRIIELGWSIGTLDCDSPVVKSYLIQPNGFIVSTDATEKHNISHEMAVAGRPLRDVLEEFVSDVFPLCCSGARVAAHHLEFDAGLLRREFGRAGLVHLIEQWDKIARQGICTMEPEIVHWLRQSKDIDLPKYKPWSLTKMVQSLNLATDAMMEKHHRAGNDSYMHWILCCELVRRSRTR